MKPVLNTLSLRKISIFLFLLSVITILLGIISSPGLFATSESENPFEWYCPDGNYKRGQALGEGGSVTFRFRNVTKHIPITFTVTDGGECADTFQVTGSGFNPQPLAQRTRDGRVVSQTYFIPQVYDGLEITVKDDGKKDEEDPSEPRYQGADIVFSAHLPKVYVVSRKKGEALPSTNHYLTKEKLYPPDTTIELFSILRLKVVDEEKKGIIPQYYLGPTTTASPRPLKAQIYAHQVTLLSWEWDELNIDWKEVIPLTEESSESASEDEIEGAKTKEESLDWQGWDYSQTLKTGEKWYRTYINAPGSEDALASAGEDRAHHISIQEESDKGGGERDGGGEKVPWHSDPDEYGGGGHIGNGGSVDFIFEEATEEIPIIFRVTDGGQHSETFTVSTTGMNAQLLYTRSRTCCQKKGPACGTHIISRTYRATGVSIGDKVTVTDNSSDHELPEAQQGADIHFTAYRMRIEIISPDPSTFTFVSQDPRGTPVQITATAITYDPNLDSQIVWQVVDDPDDAIDSGDPVPEPVTAGSTLTFTIGTGGVPPAALNGRGAPLAYRISAGITVEEITYLAMITIVQDERDQCRQEYIDMSKTKVPNRGEFSNGGGSDHFTFGELNSGHYSWAILTSALYAGLEATRTNYGYPMDVSSGYRNPIRNAELPGSATESQHIYGLAADIYVRDLNGNGEIERSEWDVLKDAAVLAGAWVEPWEDTGTWVHMDWGH